MKQILMIATGGTMASKESEQGLHPQLTSKELLNYVPNAKTFCHIDTIQLLNIDSTNMQPCHWLLMAQCIEEHYASYDGFVVCHGTDTMAYTASALSYLIQDSLKPVVVTGSQKPIDLDITDGKTNLLDSLYFACCEKAHGVTIVFDGKVIAGTRGKKERTKSYHAFSSINFPYLATIQDGHIIFYVDDKSSIEKPVSFYHTLNSKVALLTLIPSLDAGVLDYLAEHYDGLIIQSFGVGGLPAYDSGDFLKAVHRWVAAGKVVVMATQVTNEGSNMSIYQVGKSIKQDLHLLEAYDMTLESTVAKLMWVLGQTMEPEQVSKAFYQTINRDLLFPFHGKSISYDSFF